MELTEMIIGSAMAVHRAMGPGLDEKIYENSMCIELAELGIAFSQQDQSPAFYKSHFVGKLITDLIVANKVILELKVADSITETHITQSFEYQRFSLPCISFSGSPFQILPYIIP